MLISGGALIREGRLVQNGSKGGRLIGGRRLFERGRLIEDLRYVQYYNYDYDYIQLSIIFITYLFICFGI